MVGSYHSMFGAFHHVQGYIISCRLMWCFWWVTDAHLRRLMTCHRLLSARRRQTGNVGASLPTEDCQNVQINDNLNGKNYFSSLLTYVHLYKCDWCTYSHAERHLRSVYYCTTYIPLATSHHWIQVGQSFWAQHAEVQHANCQTDQKKGDRITLDVVKSRGCKGCASKCKTHYVYKCTRMYEADNKSLDIQALRR